MEEQIEVGVGCLELNHGLEGELASDGSKIHAVSDRDNERRLKLRDAWDSGRSSRMDRRPSVSMRVPSEQRVDGDGEGSGRSGEVRLEIPRYVKHTTL